MEIMNANIKTEPNVEEHVTVVSGFPIENVKHESISDGPAVVEFDDRIFLHNSSAQQHKELPDTDDHLGIDENCENFVFTDEIIKEEPIFYDSSDV